MTLVGNKCDLPDKDRVVFLDQVQELAQKLGPNVSVMETSALAEINVNEVKKGRTSAESNRVLN